MGTPEIEIVVGGSYLRLPIKNRSDGKVVMLQGGGAGVGVGLSISIPFVNASGSLDAFPSTGLGAIYRGYLAPIANIKVDEKSLTISAAAVGTYCFKPIDVVSIKGKSFLFTRGISIKHVNAAFPKRIIFIPSIADLMPEDIKHIGFIPQANPEDLKKFKYSLYTLPTFLTLIMVFSIFFWILLFLHGQN